MPSKCARPGCDEAEHRIHGYCSVYCRDVDCERQELVRAEAERDRYRAALAVIAGKTTGDPPVGQSWRDVAETCIRHARGALTRPAPSPDPMPSDADRRAEAEQALETMDEFRQALFVHLNDEDDERWAAAIASARAVLAPPAPSREPVAWGDSWQYRLVVAAQCCGRANHHPDTCERARITELLEACGLAHQEAPDGE